MDSMEVSKIMGLSFDPVFPRGFSSPTLERMKKKKKKKQLEA